MARGVERPHPRRHDPRGAVTRTLAAERGVKPGPLIQRPASPPPARRSVPGCSRCCVVGTRSRDQRLREAGDCCNRASASI
jgi:hypothetical protein